METCDHLHLHDIESGKDEEDGEILKTRLTGVAPALHASQNQGAVLAEEAVLEIDTDSLTP